MNKNQTATGSSCFYVVPYCTLINATILVQVGTYYISLYLERALSRGRALRVAETRKKASFF